MFCCIYCIYFISLHMKPDLNTDFISGNMAHKQRCNHVFKVGSPVPWSWVLLSFTENIRQVYPVWFSQLHNHTVFIKKLRQKLGGLSKFGGPDSPRPPSGCAHAHKNGKKINAESETAIEHIETNNCQINSSTNYIILTSCTIISKASLQVTSYCYTLFDNNVQ